MSLLQNVDGRFRHATEAAGVGAERHGRIVGWGTAFFDFDNDGWLDLFLAATGYAPRFSDPGAPIDLLFLPHPNVLFRNRGYGNYVEVTPPSWQARPRPSMGVAYADYDRDGFVDLVVGNFDVGYTLYPNAGLAGADNHWLTVRLEGRGPINRDAIGARVFVTPRDGRTRSRPRMQEVKSGSSLGAGNDTALHFGLGGSATATVRVLWPDGTEAVFEEVAGDRVWRVVYGHPSPRPSRGRPGHRHAAAPHFTSARLAQYHAPLDHHLHRDARRRDPDRSGAQFSRSRTASDRASWGGMLSNSGLYRKPNSRILLSRVRRVMPNSAAARVRLPSQRLRAATTRLRSFSFSVPEVSVPEVVASPGTGAPPAGRSRSAALSCGPGPRAAA